MENSDNLFNSRLRTEKSVAPLQELVNKAIKELDTKLDKESTFDDFIESYIKGRSYKEIEDKFNYLSDVWALTGRKYDANKTYNKYFKPSEELFKASESTDFYNDDTKNQFVKFKEIKVSSILKGNLIDLYRLQKSEKTLLSISIGIITSIFMGNIFPVYDYYRLSRKQGQAIKVSERLSTYSIESFNYSIAIVIFLLVSITIYFVLTRVNNEK
jgi:hypothetical protein